MRLEDSELDRLFMLKHKGAIIMLQDGRVINTNMRVSAVYEAIRVEYGEDDRTALIEARCGSVYILRTSDILLVLSEPLESEK